MNKSLVYPFDLEFAPILRHREMLRNFEITKIVSPFGWGCCGKDASFTDGGGHIGITVEADFEKALSKCDTVLFVDSHGMLDFEKSILPKAEKALQNGRKIIYARTLGAGEREKLTTACGTGAIDFSYQPNDKEIGEHLIDESLYDITTPVTFITGNAECASKFEIQLSIRQELVKLGYRISQIGSRGFCGLLGFHSMPSFMTGCAIPDYIKITMFNHFLKSIELCEKPDIIVIGIPGGIMPISKKFTCKYGISAFEISQAVRPDYVILSTLYDDFKDSYFEKFCGTVEKKFGYGVDLFNISGKKIEWTDSDEEEELTYLTLDTGFVDKKLSSLHGYHKNLFNILDRNASKEICDKMISKLSEYAYVKSM